MFLCLGCKRKTIAEDVFLFPKVVWGVSPACRWSGRGRVEGVAIVAAWCTFPPTNLDVKYVFVLHTICAYNAMESCLYLIPSWLLLLVLLIYQYVRHCVVLQVLERVALAYPRALFFPLLMTKASAARRGGGGGTAAASDGERFSKLTALTADPSGEAFAEVVHAADEPRAGCPALHERILFPVANSLCIEKSEH